MIDAPILYTKLEPIQIAFIKTRIESRDLIPALFERLRSACGKAICGEALVIFHGGAVKDGFIIEATFPVTHVVETGEVHTRTLEAAPALITLHYGSHQTIRETVLKVYAYLDQHACTTSLFRREIYRVLDVAQPENNLTEVQIILHEWDRLFAEGAEKVFGVEARQNLAQGIESITPQSSFDEYTAWMQGAIERLDALTDDNEKKCQVVSHCAHVFPQERIDYLREIYQRGAFDEHEAHERLTRSGELASNNEAQCNQGII